MQNSQGKVHLVDASGQVFFCMSMAVLQNDTYNHQQSNNCQHIASITPTALHILA